MNELVDLLRNQGCWGPKKSLSRDTIARWLDKRDVREVKSLAEANRLSGELPVVAYSSRRGKSGYYLTEDPDEIEALRLKIFRECRKRLRQVKSLRTSRQRAETKDGVGQRTLFAAL